MADITKFNNNGTLISDIKSHFSITKSKRSVSLAYGLIFSFIAFTTFFVFMPSSNSSSLHDFFIPKQSNRDLQPNNETLFPGLRQDQIQNEALDDTVGVLEPRNDTILPVLNKTIEEKRIPPKFDRNEVRSVPFHDEVGISEPKDDTLLPSFKQTVDEKKEIPPKFEQSQVQSETFPDEGRGLEPKNDTLLPPSNQAVEKQKIPPKFEQNQVQSETFPDEVRSMEPKNATLLPPSNQTVEKQKIPPKFDQNQEVRRDTFHDDVGMLEPKNDTLLPPSNQTVEKQKIPPKFDQNQEVQSENLHDKVGVLAPMDETSLPSENHTAVDDKRSLDWSQNQTHNIEPGILKNGTNRDGKVKKGMNEVINSLMECDLFDGNWVRDNSYPLYKPGSCSLIDEQFNCFRNGRTDTGYQKLKWKPKGCTLPRLRGRHMLKMLRGKRLVFVGDSLNRNMWESLICILKNSVNNQKKVYERSGRYKFRKEASYSFVFEEYNSTVEFFVSPFLVQQSEAINKNGTMKETLRLDLIGNLSSHYIKADIIVFNTANWWNVHKTSYGKDFYQEGSHVHSKLDTDEAFRKALTTWGRWVDTNINPVKSLVFFRGSSKSHFSGGQWNSGGNCGNQTEPIVNDKYLAEYPSKMVILESVLRGMKTQVTYLNVTKLTDYRKDGHPSMYRYENYSEEQRKSVHQDCSHWCLPGVPDAWNEILYAELLLKLYKNKMYKNQ